MKQFRMKKQKIVKPDGRWMYMYTFEEEAGPQRSLEERAERETKLTPRESEKEG